MTIYEPETEWVRANTRLFDGDNRGRTYVDLGCGHPERFSQTRICRDFSWRGLAIDGNHDYWVDWEMAGHASHFCCAILSDQPTARFSIHENSFTSRLCPHGEEHPEKWGISRILESESVQPLNEILAAHEIGKIHFLTADLEGTEFSVIQTLDFEKHAPDVIVAEYNTSEIGIDPRLCNFLLTKGYRVAQQFPSNLIYIRNL